MVKRRSGVGQKSGVIEQGSGRLCLRGGGPSSVLRRR